MDMSIMDEDIIGEPGDLDKVEYVQAPLGDPQSSGQQIEEEKVCATAKHESMSSLAARIGVPQKRVFKMMKMEREGKLIDLPPMGRPIKKKAWTPEIIRLATAHSTLRS